MRRLIQQSMMMLVGGTLLSACAHQNALMQSPVANNTQTIDQINTVLDDIVKDEQKPTEVPLEVSAALVPDMVVPGTAKPAPENRFDIAVDNLNAQDFFHSLVDGTNMNMVVHPEVAGKISLTLKGVTVSDVMDITKDIYGFDYQEKGNLIKVYPSGLYTRIFEIDYLDIARKGGSETRVSSGQITQTNTSDEDSDGGSSKTSENIAGTLINTYSESNFWASLSQTLQLIIGNKEGRSVVLTPNAGMVVVRANSDELSAVQRYLESAELIMQRQVILEAKILEVDLNESYQQGIDWTFQEAGEFSNGVPRRSIDLGQSAREILTDTSGGVFASTIGLGNFNATIELLGTQGNVQVLSSPRIATVNNQKAVIKVGSDEYFVTDIDFESDTDADSDSTDITLTPFFSGIALDVTPQISEEGDIILHVHPTISEVEDQNKVITIGGREVDLPLALSTIRESDSVITAENGQIVVIGGLISSRSVDDNASVPFFGDIPLVGELFKQKAELMKKTELVILLRPTITDRDSIYADIRSSRDRFGKHRELMSSPPVTNFYD